MKGSLAPPPPSLMISLRSISPDLIEFAIPSVMINSKTRGLKLSFASPPSAVFAALFIAPAASFEKPPVTHFAVAASIDFAFLRSSDNFLGSFISPTALLTFSFAFAIAFCAIAFPESNAFLTASCICLITVLMTLDTSPPNLIIFSCAPERASLPFCFIVSFAFCNFSLAILNKFSFNSSSVKLENVSKVKLSKIPSSTISIASERIG